jgi:hypothetical protein
MRAVPAATESSQSAPTGRSAAQVVRGIRKTERTERQRALVRKREGARARTVAIAGAERGHCARA